MLCTCALSQKQMGSPVASKVIITSLLPDDPARVLTHELSGVPNSVLKFLVELFSDSATAELFYLNDVAVLLDIVARQLSDLPPGDKVSKHTITLQRLDVFLQPCLE